MSVNLELQLIKIKQECSIESESFLPAKGFKFTCKICHETFKTLVSRDKHEKKHEYLVKCEICSKYIPDHRIPQHFAKVSWDLKSNSGSKIIVSLKGTWRRERISMWELRRWLSDETRSSETSMDSSQWVEGKENFILLFLAWNYQCFHFSFLALNVAKSSTISTNSLIILHHLASLSVTFVLKFTQIKKHSSSIWPSFTWIRSDVYQITFIECGLPENGRTSIENQTISLRSAKKVNLCYVPIVTSRSTERFLNIWNKKFAGKRNCFCHFLKEKLIFLTKSDVATVWQSFWNFWLINYILPMFNSLSWLFFT